MGEGREDSAGKEPRKLLLETKSIPAPSGIPKTWISQEELSGKTLFESGWCFGREPQDSLDLILGATLG